MQVEPTSSSTVAMQYPVIAMYELERGTFASMELMSWKYAIVIIIDCHQSHMCMSNLHSLERKSWLTDEVWKRMTIHVLIIKIGIDFDKLYGTGSKGSC